MKKFTAHFIILSMLVGLVSCVESRVSQDIETENRSELVTALNLGFQDHNIELSSDDLEKLEMIFKIAERHNPDQELNMTNPSEDQINWFTALLRMEEEDIDLVFEYTTAMMKLAVTMNEESKKLAEKWHPLKQEAITADDTEEFNRLSQLHEQERRELNQALNDSLGLSEKKMQRFKEIAQTYVAPFMDDENQTGNMNHY